MPEEDYSELYLIFSCAFSHPTQTTYISNIAFLVDMRYCIELRRSLRIEDQIETIAQCGLAHIECGVNLKAT